MKFYVLRSGWGVGMGQDVSVHWHLQARDGTHPGTFAWGCQVSSLLIIGQFVSSTQTGIQVLAHHAQPCQVAEWPRARHALLPPTPMYMRSAT